MTKRGLALLLALAVSMTAHSTLDARQNASLSPATRQKLVESLNKASAFLAKQQRPDGTFDNHPGITAMAAAALLRQPGQRDKQLATVGKTLDYLKGLAKPDGG